MQRVAEHTSTACVRRKVAADELHLKAAVLRTCSARPHHPHLPQPRTHSLSLHKHIHPAGFTVLLVVEVEAGMRKHADVPWKYLSGPSTPPHPPMPLNTAAEGGRTGTGPPPGSHNYTITRVEREIHCI